MAGIVSETSQSATTMTRVATELAPIALFVYRRPAHTARLLTSLAGNRLSGSSILYIFSDAPACDAHCADVAEVRALVRDLRGFGRVIVVERDNNIGCAANVIDGVSQVLRDYDRVIVIEDDLELSPHFLGFMNQALDTYRDRKDVFSVSAASPPPQALGMAEEGRPDVYLAPRSVPWGWATWADRWKGVDWQLAGFAGKRWKPTWRRRMARGGNDLLSMLDDQMTGRIDSWNVRFNHAQAMAGSYSLYPCYAYVRNAGLDGSGLHCRATDRYEINLRQAIEAPCMLSDIQPDRDLMRAVKSYHDEHPLSLWLGSVPGVRAAIRSVKKHLGVDRPLLKRKP